MTDDRSVDEVRQSIDELWGKLAASEQRTCKDCGVALSSRRTGPGRPLTRCDECREKRTCKDCGTALPPQSGPGHPRLRCDECRGRKPKPVAECGTTSGYQRHHRQGEDPCKACRDAWAAYHLRRRMRLEGWDL